MSFKAYDFSYIQASMCASRQATGGACEQACGVARSSLVWVLGANSGERPRCLLDVQDTMRGWIWSAANLVTERDRAGGQVSLVEVPSRSLGDACRQDMLSVWVV